MSNNTNIYVLRFSPELTMDEFRTTDQQLALEAQSVIEGDGYEVDFCALVLGSSRPGALNSAKLRTFVDEHKNLATAAR